MQHQCLSGLMASGLSEKEAQLYLTALKTGPQSAQNLALESGLKRATIYGLIESLISKGLFHIEIKGTGKRYVAEAPDKLAALLEKKKQMLASIMPSLVQEYLHSSPTANTIKMYYGLSGIRLIYENILEGLKPGDDYLVISDQNKWYTLDPDYFEAFLKKRSTLQLLTRLILQDNQHARDYQLKEDHYQEKIKLLPNTINLNINMVIYAQNVLMVQTVEPFLAILIENPNVAAMCKILFNTIWELTE